MTRPTANQRPHVPGVDTMPGLGMHDETNPMAWVERLEQTARACRSNTVKLSKRRLVGMCVLLRLFGKLLTEIDKGDMESARKHLNALIAQMEMERPLPPVSITHAKGTNT